MYFLRICISLTLLISFLRVSAQSNHPPEIHYVGNMGVAIVYHDSVVLIDALHDYYKQYYLPSDTAILSKILLKQFPYRYLVAVSATHIHGDHFDSSLFAKISQALPQAQFIMGRQFEPLLAGIRKGAAYFADDMKVFKVSDNIHITIRRIAHVGGARSKDINDYRVEVKWSKYRFVHFGDAEVSENTFSRLQPGADIAIIPTWFSTDSEAISLIEKSKFKKCIITHIDPAEGPPKPRKSNIEFLLFAMYGDKYSLK